MPDPSLTPRARAGVVYAACSALVLGAAGLCAQAPDQPTRSYHDLPPAQQRTLLTGEPRSSRQIADSPFGTLTTICAEGGPREYIEQAAAEIAAAGYKWVGEYVQLTWRRGAPPQLAAAATWSRLPARCSEYLARLQAHDIRVLMRLDPLPTRMLRGAAPFTAEDLALATAYTRNVVAQLKPFVKHWQIGNEPNLGNAPQAYVRVAQAVGRALRAEQPDAVLYGPAVSMLQCMTETPYPWIANALRLGLLDSIDVFSFHPYRSPGDQPEQASQFARARRWGSYADQLAALRGMLRTHRAAAPRLAVTEDGEATAISADGEQRITPIINAKHELRRALLDFNLGIYPRIHFVFFRDIPHADYSHQGSYNTLRAGLQKKPLYYAAQNLHAVLDSSYAPTSAVRTKLSLMPPHAGTDPGCVVQTYVKHHPGFDELLVFFWASVPAQNVHVRLPAALWVSGADWEAPVLIDLMTMPGHARSLGHEVSSHKRATFPRARKLAGGVRVDALQLRDYPQLLKLVRPAAAEP